MATQMYADVQKTCVDCGANFWWTVGEQEFFEQMGYVPPKRCQDCRAKKKARQAYQPETDTALVPAKSGRKSAVLVPRGPQLPALPEFPREFTDRASLFADIQQLLGEATAPVMDRRRSFFEWLRGVDVKAEQIARKMQAAHTADDLVQQRTALFEHLQQMIAAATNAELARLHAHIRLQEAQLQAIELQEQINQRRALAGQRFQTQQLREHVEQRRLLQSVEEKPEDEEQTIIEEHRQTLRAKARSRQKVLSDFLQQIDLICRTRLTVHEKSLRIRAMLDAFEMDEDSLPENARRILKRAERLNDVA